MKTQMQDFCLPGHPKNITAAMLQVFSPADAETRGGQIIRSLVSQRRMASVSCVLSACRRRSHRSAALVTANSAAAVSGCNPDCSAERICLINRCWLDSHSYSAMYREKHRLRRSQIARTLRETNGSQRSAAARLNPRSFSC